MIEFELLCSRRTVKGEEDSVWQIHSVAKLAASSISVPNANHRSPRFAAAPVQRGPNPAFRGLSLGK